MKTREMPVNELSGPALDWAVAVVEDKRPHLTADNQVRVVSQYGEDFSASFEAHKRWGIAGPLRDKYDMSITPIGNRVEAGINIPTGGDDYDSLEIVGSTACEAICRLVVLRCLGPTVDIPAVLVNEGE